MLKPSFHYGTLYFDYCSIRGTLESYAPVGNAVTVNWVRGNRQKITLTGISGLVTVTFTDLASSAGLTLYVVADASNTPSFSWPVSITWANGGEPTWAAGNTYRIFFDFDGTTYYAVPLDVAGAAGRFVFGTQAYFDAETNNTVTANAATVNWTTGNKQKLTMDAATGTVTISFTAPTGPTNCQLKIVYNDTDTVAFTGGGLSIKWSGGTEPTWTHAAGKTDIAMFYF